MWVKSYKLRIFKFNRRYFITFLKLTGSMRWLFLSLIPTIPEETVSSVINKVKGTAKESFNLKASGNFSEWIISKEIFSLNSPWIISSTKLPVSFSLEIRMLVCIGTIL